MDWWEVWWGLRPNASAGVGKAKPFAVAVGVDAFEAESVNAMDATWANRRWRILRPCSASGDYPVALGEDVFHELSRVGEDLVDCIRMVTAGVVGLLDADLPVTPGSVPFRRQ